MTLLKSPNAHPVSPFYLNLSNFEHYANMTTAWDKFIGQYPDLNKKPSLFLIPVIEGKIRDFPSVIFESGWGESGPLSISDLSISDLSISDSPFWLEGTGGAVKIVIFLKTFTPDQENKIKATLTLCRNDPCGAIVKIERVCSSFPYCLSQARSIRKYESRVCNTHRPFAIYSANPCFRIILA